MAQKRSTASTGHVLVPASSSDVPFTNVEDLSDDAEFWWLAVPPSFLNRCMRRLTRSWSINWVPGMEARESLPGINTITLSFTISGLATGFIFVALVVPPPDFSRSSWGSTDDRTRAFIFFGFLSFGLCLVATLWCSQFLSLFDEAVDQRAFLRRHCYWLIVPIMVLQIGLIFMLCTILVVVSAFYELVSFICIAVLSVFIVFLNFYVSLFAMVPLSVQEQWRQYNSAVRAAMASGRRIVLTKEDRDLWGEKWKGWIARGPPNAPRLAEM